jgi:ribosomal protein S27E
MTVRCPACTTTDIRFRQGVKSFVCRRCGNIWKDVPKPPGTDNAVPEGMIRVKAYSRNPNTVLDHVRKLPSKKPRATAAAPAEA